MSGIATNRTNFELPNDIANCDCMYAVRFNSNTFVEGYQPNKYLKMYNSADPGGSPKDKINAMRRLFYAERGTEEYDV